MVGWICICTSMPLTSPVLLGLEENLLVKETFEGNRWMEGSERVSSVEEMDQFFVLWQKIQSVDLSDTPDSICWSLT